MPRGVEAAARGGARVAGSNDPQALWYNPAGLVASGRQLLVDSLLPIQRTEFTRYYDNGDHAPTVHATSLIPIPTIAYSDNFGLKDWGFGAALMIPPASGGKYPSTVNGLPAPQRYSILDADNSYAASFMLGAAYRPLRNWSVGVAVYASVAQVGATIAVSGCDYAICAQPEGAEWEGRARLLLGPEWSATAVFGTTYAIKWVTLGASLQLRTKFKGDAQFDVSLPDQKVFDDVTIENQDGSTDLKLGTEVQLPMIARAGIEFAPLKQFKFELAGTWENWGAQQSIQLDPKGIVIKGIPGLGDMPVDKTSLDLNMRDTWAVQLGGSYDIAPHLQWTKSFAFNLGFMYETGAYETRDLSPTALDTNKFLLGLGASIEVSRNVIVDITYGHIFMQDHVVTNSRVTLPNLSKPDPVDETPGKYAMGDAPTIGNGSYAMEADFIGLGVRWKLDPLK
jgi:long-chain fatty acid transport protein